MSIIPEQTNKSSGFTLLEVMIAMVIFAVGMLGLAGIQALALQNNNTAYMRTIAMQQSYNMADLLRLSKDFNEVIDSNYAPVTTALGSTPSKDCIADDLTTNCSISELAVFDIFHWKTRMAKALPAGRGTVTKTGNVYEIIIMWDEKRTGVTGEGCSGNSAVDLKCYTLHAGV